MEKTDINKYCDVMEEIKKRISVIDYFLSGAGHALYEPTTIESICLQFRKILELIAMATLVANKNEYSKVYSNFAKSWNAEYLLNDLSRINPNFYPKPMIEALDTEPGIKSQLIEKTVEILTKDEFIKIYKKCGGALHASNPLGRKVNYEYFKKNIPEWRKKIINLLNTHQIKLLNQQGFYLVHMQEDRDNKVHCYTFEPHNVKNS